MAKAIVEHLIGNTVKVTWVSSGANPTDVSLRIFDKDATLVSSSTMTESGSGVGHFYHFQTLPDSPGSYVAETLAVIGSKNYKKRIRFRCVSGGV